jgi:hypothetical protein
MSSPQGRLGRNHAPKGDALNFACNSPATASPRVADHLTIGQGAKVGAKSGVAQNVPPGGEVFGLPASERRHAGRQVAALRRLPELLERVRELEKRLEELEGRAEEK